MRMRGFRLSGMVAAMGFWGVFLMTGCATKKTEKVESVADIQKREGIPVRVVTVQPQNIELIEAVGGTAEGFLQTTVNSIGAGKISRIAVAVGDVVGKDASLMTMELDAAQNFELAKKQYETAEKTRDRIKKLKEQGGASQEMLDNAETALAGARETLGASKKSEFIPAPFAGTIVSIYPSLNSIVDKVKPLIDIASIDTIKLNTTVSESVINRFKTGQPAVVVVSGDTIKGAVSEVSLIGSANHTFIVKLVFGNGKRLIRPGMYLGARVMVERRFKVLALPLEMVRNDGENRYVWVIRKGCARRVTVVTGIRSGGRYEIDSGLSAGDSVVSSGAGNLVENAKVKIVQ